MNKYSKRMYNYKNPFRRFTNMSKREIKQMIKEIIDLIAEYFEKLADAMCDGDSYHEGLYLNKIKLLEYRKEELELALN
jgi:cytochrome c peroxidase